MENKAEILEEYHPDLARFVRWFPTILLINVNDLPGETLNPVILNGTIKDWKVIYHRRINQNDLPSVLQWIQGQSLNQRTWSDSIKDKLVNTWLDWKGR